MKQIELDKLCLYCYGCNKLEQEEFIGVRSCNGFIPVIPKWQSEYLKGLRGGKR